MDTKSPYEIYSQNITNKLFYQIQKKFKTSSKKELILSEKFEPLFLTNKNLVKKIKSENILISFIERINPENYSLTVTNIIFLSKIEKNQFLKMINYMNKFFDHHGKKNLNILFFVTPRKNFLTKILFEKNSNYITKKFVKKIFDLNFDFFPIFENLLTLNYKLGFHEILKKDNFFFLNLSGESLHKFQILFGEFKYIIGKGENSKKVINIIKNLKKDFKRDLNFTETFYDSCFIFDRNEDLITPLLFQFTYNGLLDEIFGIELNSIFIKKKILEKNFESDKKFFFNLKKKGDLIFKNYRDLHFSDFVKNLKKSIQDLKLIKQNPENFKNLEKTLKIAEKIKNKPFIEFHLSLTSKIDEFLKNPLNRERIKLLQQILIKNCDKKILISDLVNLIEIEADLKIVINVIILFNLVLKGFEENVYYQIWELLINCYGVSILHILLNLKKYGFFVIKNSKNENLDFIKKNDFFNKNFDLIKTDTNIFNKKDLYNSYTGYKPISIFYLEFLLKNEKSLNLDFYKENENFDFLDFSESKNICLFFLGGITYGEISCVKKLGEIYNKNFMILTTSVISSNSFLNVFLHNDEN